MANETWKFVQAKSKQAMKQVLGIRDEKARMKVTPPWAVAPITLEDTRKCRSRRTSSNTGRGRGPPPWERNKMSGEAFIIMLLW